MRSIAVVNADASVFAAIHDAVGDEADVVSLNGSTDSSVLRGSTADVLVVDGDDPNAFEHLRSLDARAKTVEIFLTTCRMGVEAERAAEALGAADCVQVPAEREVLRQRLRAALERARQRGERDSRLSELMESEERYALAAKGASEGLWHWDVRTDHFHASARWRRIVGFDDDAHITMSSWVDLICEPDRRAVQHALDAHVMGETSEFVAEFRVETAEHLKWVFARGTAVRNDSGEAVRVAGSLSDVTLRREVEAQLAFDAMHDSLTGLPNRNLCMDRLMRAMARARRHGQSFGILFLDMDRFKTINDSLGHLAGDELLLEAARRMESCLRETDTVARLGGDEFVILIDELNGETDATRVAERILEKLNRPFKLSGHEVYSTASIGIALYNVRYSRAEEMLRDADIAMYRAKAAGKSCYRVFDEAMHKRAIELLQLETDLRRAVEREEFRLHYQPLVDLHSGELVGCEALLRWHRRGSSFVLPDTFIPLAEETGLIIPIGRWVLTEACERLRELSDHRGENLHLSVNISGRQFSQPDFVEEVAAILKETGVSAESVTLEITESVIMEDPEFARETLRRLKELHVGLAIDDFGTGYSSLAYLQKFPIDTLKVDRSFVQLLEHGGYELEIVKTIAHLARTLGLEVVAEGVESAAQREILTELGYRVGQGFLFAKPMSGSDMFGFAGRGVG